MTSPQSPHGRLPGPPYTLDDLADLQAGVFDDDAAAAFRSQLAGDPQAAVLLAALDATTADLAAWYEPAPIPMPAQYQARLDAAIADEAAARATRSASNVVSLESATRTRSARTTRRWAAGLGVAAAVAAVIAISAITLRPNHTPGTAEAGGQPGTTTTVSTPALGGPGAGSPSDDTATTGLPGGPGNPGQAVVADPNHLEDLLTQVVGVADAGPLADPTRMAQCLDANGVKDTVVLGAIPVTFQGQAAYAISLGLDQATARILIVGPNCGDPGPDLLASQTAGR